MVLTIDEVNDILDAACEALPPALFDGLTGGIILSEDALPDPDAGKDVYILGEYCWDAMGQYIVIYYGSFVELFRYEPRSVWEEELGITLRHELTHHVEGRAGAHSLERKDEAELEAMRQGLDLPE